MSPRVRLDEHVYEQIGANTREHVSFSDAVERLIGGRSLRGLRDVLDAEQVDEMRGANERADEEDCAEVDDVAERFERSSTRVSFWTLSKASTR